MHMEAPQIIDFERYAAGLTTPGEEEAVIRHLEENPAMLTVVIHLMRRRLMPALGLSPLTDPLAYEEDLDL